jgi:hypothetical protein
MQKEIKILENLIAEIYEVCEHTRIEGYSDDQMFEANANLEFTVTVGRELQSEIIAYGRPSSAKLLNAMSNPQTLQMLSSVGLVPEGTTLLTAGSKEDFLKLAAAVSSDDKKLIGP